MPKHKINVVLEIDIDDDYEKNEVFNVTYSCGEPAEDIVSREIKKIVPNAELMDVGKFESGFVMLSFQKKKEEEEEEKEN